jgi:hypothetical protein
LEREEEEVVGKDLGPGNTKPSIRLEEAAGQVIVE